MGQMRLPFRIARGAFAGVTGLWLVGMAPPPLPPPLPPGETVPLSSPLAFQVWLALKPARAGDVRAFERYLGAQRVAGVVPLHQIMRSESDWARCRGEPFVVAPRALWPNIVKTLRFLRARVVPAIGPVNVVSGYRSAPANACSGGARASAHLGFFALDLVPAGALGRAAIIARLCAVHAAHGAAANIGLGFYGGRRFHVDSLRFRRWGADHHGASSPCGAAR
jgi:hypothetical protein